MSHYEAFQRTPSLPTAFLLLIALDKPMEDLFRGLQEEAQRLVAARANALLEEEFNAKRASPRHTAREQWLQRLAGDEQTILPL